MAPATARDLDGGLPRVRDQWGWNWSETKKVLEHLFLAGELAVAGRTPSFERLYDLPERVLPRAVLEAPVPTRAEATRELVLRAARALGVCDERSVRDYFRMGPGEVGPALESLVAEGELVPVSVEGMRAAYLHRDARVPRAVRARTLVSPFDPLVWERRRTELIFGFRYRIEIYVPAARRVHGYYVLPFLLGDALVARVDLKADRKRGMLLVQAAHAEPSAPPQTAEELAVALWELAGWLGLDDVDVQPPGRPGRGAQLCGAADLCWLSAASSMFAAMTTASDSRMCAPSAAAAARCGAFSDEARHRGVQLLRGGAPADHVIPAPARLDRAAHRRVVEHRVQRHHQDGEVVGEGTHGGPVAAVADDQREPRHELAVRDVTEHLDPGRGVDLLGSDHRAGRHDHARPRVPHGCVDQALQEAPHPRVVEGAQADQHAGSAKSARATGGSIAGPTNRRFAGARSAPGSSSGSVAAMFSMAWSQAALGRRPRARPHMPTGPCSQPPRW